MVMAGGAIDHFGMPVDPGNLILLAHRGQTTLIGLPGCARSPKMNGFDWVLQRLVAGIPVGRADIMAMGTGGLLKEIPNRPLPRAQAVDDAANGLARAPRVAALDLAAGRFEVVLHAAEHALPDDLVLEGRFELSPDLILSAMRADRTPTRP